MKRSRYSLRQLGVGLAVLLLVVPGVSCNRSGGRPVYPVRGQVLLDGKPLAGVMVTFHPAALPTDPNENHPYARTDAEGRFSASTHGTGDGAPAGEYRITIHDVQSGGGGDDSPTGGGPPKTNRVPAIYTKPETSGLSIQVAEGPNDLPPFQLKPGPTAPVQQPRSPG